MTSDGAWRRQQGSGTKLVANNEYQRIANSRLILRELLRGKRSRVQLARDLGLQPSTVTYSTARLIEAGIVKEDAEPARSEGTGRRGILLGLDPNYGVVAGVELLSGQYRLVICDITGAEMVRETCMYDESATAPKGTRSRFLQLLACVDSHLRETCGSRPIRGLCIAVPGIVSKGGCRIEDSWTHGLVSEDFTDELAAFPYPVWFENDANSAAVKYTFANVRENDCFLYALVHFHEKKNIPERIPSVGIGMGIVLNGALFRGYSDRAGEFRSFLYDDVVSPGQLHMSNENLNAMVSDRAKHKVFLAELLRNLLSIEAVINPRIIYLGGELVDGDLVSEVMRESFSSSGRRRSAAGGPIIETLEDPTWDVSQGACVCVLDRMFCIPRVGDRRDEIAGACHE